MADENKVDPSEGKSTPEPTPTPPVETPPVNSSTPDIPDKFRGKPVEEVMKAYKEAEQELGKLKNEIGNRPSKEEYDKLKTAVEQWDALGEVIKGNPALLKAVEEEVKVKSSPDSDPEKKDDVRESLTIRTIGEFESRFGIDALPQEQRTALHVKIGNELKELLDPDGKKTTQKIIQDIPLDKLPRYLEKAYKLATGDDAKEKARLEGIIQSRQNGEATFGTITSSSTKSEESLTPEQREVARKLGVSEENYLKQLKKDTAN